jgi:hypothetical protein
MNEVQIHGMSNLVRALESTRVETLGFFKLGEPELSRSYGPGKWSVRFLLHHLADTETVLYERIRRAISEPHPTVNVMDQDAWAKELDYTGMPLEISRDIYTSVRSAVIHLARLRYDTHGHLTFVHSVTGVRTVRNEFDKVAQHNALHLGHIRIALRNHTA